MKVYQEINSLEEFAVIAWSGAIYTINEIMKDGKEQEAWSYIETMFSDMQPSITTINDILWHDSKSIYEFCGMTETDEFDDDDDEGEFGCIVDEDDDEDGDDDD